MLYWATLHIYKSLKRNSAPRPRWSHRWLTEEILKIETSSLNFKALRPFPGLRSNVAKMTHPLWSEKDSFNPCCCPHCLLLADTVICCRSPSSESVNTEPTELVKYYAERC